MPDLQALIRACKDEPDDDAPRLILADWLEENGEADRAAFIRRQIAFPNGEFPFRAEWLGEWYRWGNELPNRQRVTSGNNHPAQFVRGFIHVGDMYREVYDSLDEILKPQFDWTWVESLYLGSWHEGDWTPLLKSPAIREVNSIAFSGDGYSPIIAKPLSNSPYTTKLRRLWMSEVNIGDEGAICLSQCNALSRVRRLEVSGDSIGPIAAAAMSHSEVWDELRRLSLSRNPLTSEGLSIIAHGRRRSHLEWLDLTFCDYSDDGLRELANTDCFPALKNLLLGYRIGEPPSVSFGCEGIEAVLTSTSMRNVNLSVIVLSPDPVPSSIKELEERFAPRLIVQYREVPRFRLPQTGCYRMLRRMLPSSCKKSE